MGSDILLVSNFFPPRTIGGAEIVAFREARALLSRGHRVVVLAGAEPSETAPAGTLTFDNYQDIPVYRLSMHSLAPDANFYWPSAARRLRAVVASHNVHVVHFHNVMGLGANLIPAAKQCDLRCVMTVHDHWGFCFKNTLLRANDAICANFEECSGCQSAIESDDQTRIPMRLRRDYVTWCVKQADQLVFPSTYLASAYAQAGFPSDRMTVLSNGIDLNAVPSEPKQPSSDGAVRFLWSGYLGEHKGIFVLLEALNELAGDPEVFRRCRMAIAGDGHLRSKIEAQLRSRNLTQQVQFLGRVPRSTLLSLLPATDVSVLSSIWPENEPVTLLEAIASGTATIATRLGGNTELVEDGHSGFLVNAGDAHSLAEAMRRYILDPLLAASHGKRNLERRAAFDEARTIDKLESLLTQRETNNAPPSGEPIIVTAGNASPPEQVGILIQHVHDHLLPGRTPRFIWHEWAADDEVWKNATLLWLWDRFPSEAVMNRALRRGIPVLAPTTNWTEGLARHYGGVILYNTYLEALAGLRSFLSMPQLRSDFSSCANAASKAATILSPRRAFALRSGAAI